MLSKLSNTKNNKIVPEYIPKNYNVIIATEIPQATPINKYKNKNNLYMQRSFWPYMTNRNTILRPEYPIFTIVEEDYKNEG